MKFLDLFSGIGGFRLGMERAGHEPVGWIEWDKFARKSYEVIHDVEEEWTAKDVREVESKEIPDHDVLCAGFPCQDFSQAGKRKGLEGARGTLFYEVGRIAKNKKPKYLFLENVKGLLTHNEGESFGIILQSLEQLGYDVEWQVLNSKDFGVPQNRERVFIIGHLREQPRQPIFPIKRRDRQDNDTRQIRRRSMYSTRRLRNAYESERLLFSSFRKLTPRECWRLQGFSDKHFEKANKVNSDSQLYKQAGNSVTVNVIEAIAERL